ncbi:class I SAM-dependent methyltransferase [Sphingobacterium paludis]|uniref:Methyltransferase family protein n=1 Tax=Sphingobacterium paludis TaxID=1476465 RepID=A0A4V3E0V2_9SPHI|nr:class I SAM-dependent methyltransferase [Sphingobacterium paludis]TDS07493.1 methyltransferase family protein [Sphingobacterium paludis]
MATTDELRQLAAQLAHPNGEAGSRLAKMMEETNYTMTLQALDALSVKAGDYVLEIGHGSASHVKSFLDQHPDVQYAGLEISGSMHQLATQVNQASITAGRADFRLYDGQEFPYSPASFSGILSVNTIYFIPDPTTFIAQISELLQPNGKLTLTFAKKSFMKTLPFTAYGFRLYDEEEVLRFADPHLLAFESTIQGREIVLSKNGDQVEREFLTIVWNKI